MECTSFVSVWLKVYLFEAFCCNEQVFLYLVVRVLMLELADKESPHVFENNLAIMLTSCLQLEVSYFSKTIFLQLFLYFFWIN